MPSPYPAIYVPQHHPRSKPAHCPHVDVFACKPNHGPDAAGGGLCWGTKYEDTNPEDWIETKDGWWICWNHPSPQQLVRLAPSPRLLAWHWIDGALPGQRWRIPVLLTPDNRDDAHTPYNPAVNRTWNGSEWVVDEPIRGIQEALLKITLTIPLADTAEARDAAMRDLAISLLGLGHHVSEAELVLGEWLDDLLVLHAIGAALDCPPETSRHAPKTDGVIEELQRAG